MKVRLIHKIISIVLATLIVASFVWALVPQKTDTDHTAITEAETPIIETNTHSEAFVPETDKSLETTTEIATETNESMYYDNPTDRFLYSIIDIDTMILVVGDQYTNNSAVLKYYEKLDGKWICTLSVDAWCGSNGFSNATYEGDRTTPVGCFEIGIAFGNNPDPGTELEWVDVNEYMYWVDDNTSEYYNELIDSREVPEDSWHSGEHLIDYTYSYAYSIEMKVNPPYETSAIFLHCDGGGKQTAGCIGIPEDSMVWILQHIKQDTRIAVVEYENDLDNIDLSELSER